MVAATTFGVRPAPTGNPEQRVVSRMDTEMFSLTSAVRTDTIATVRKAEGASQPHIKKRRLASF